MKIRTLVALLFLILTVTVQAFGAETAEQLKAQISHVGSSFKDLRATLVVKDANRKELEKMGKLFAETYQFKKATVCFKSPDKLKLNGALGVMKVEFITTGDVRHVRIPSMHFKKKEDITDQQEKHVTTLDVGVVTDAIWNTYQISLERIEKSDSGSPVYVLRLKTDTSNRSQLIWVDGTDFRLLRRDNLLKDDSLKVRTIYSEHKQIGGVWIPTRADVYNAEGKLAATTETRDLVANSAIDDKEFE